jgi:hypothetical protein
MPPKAQNNITLLSTNHNDYKISISDHTIDKITNNFDFWCFMENDPDERRKRQKFVICLLDTEHDHYDKGVDKNMWKLWIAHYIHERDKLFPIKIENKLLPNYSKISANLFNKIDEITYVNNQAPSTLLTNHDKWLTTCCGNATEIGFELFTRWIKRRDEAVGNNLIGYCDTSFKMPSVQTASIPKSLRASSMVYAKNSVLLQLKSIKWNTIPYTQLYYLYDQGAPNFDNIGENTWKLAIGLGGNYDKSGKNASGNRFNDTASSKVFFDGRDYEGILGYKTFELNNVSTANTVTPRWQGRLQLPGNNNPAKFTVIESPLSNPNKDTIKSVVQQFQSGITNKTTGIYQFLNSISGGINILNFLSSSKTFKEINEKGLSPTTDIKRLGDWSQSFEVKGKNQYLFATGDYLAAGIACYFNEVTTLLKIPKLSNGSTIVSPAGNLIMFNTYMSHHKNPLSCDPISSNKDELFNNYSDFKLKRNNKQLGGKRTKKNLKLKGGMKEDAEIDDIRRFVKLILNPEKYSITEQNKNILQGINNKIIKKLLSIMVGTLYWHIQLLNEKRVKDCVKKGVEYSDDKRGFDDEPIPYTESNYEVEEENETIYVPYYKVEADNSIKEDTMSDVEADNSIKEDTMSDVESDDSIKEVTMSDVEPQLYKETDGRYVPYKADDSVNKNKMSDDIDDDKPQLYKAVIITTKKLKSYTLDKDYHQPVIDEIVISKDMKPFNCIEAYKEIMTQLNTHTENGSNILINWLSAALEVNNLESIAHGNTYYTDSTDFFDKDHKSSHTLSYNQYLSYIKNIASLNQL